MALQKDQELQKMKDQMDKHLQKMFLPGAPKNVTAKNMFLLKDQELQKEHERLDKMLQLLSETKLQRKMNFQIYFKNTQLELNTILILMKIKIFFYLYSN